MQCISAWAKRLTAACSAQGKGCIQSRKEGCGRPPGPWVWELVICGTKEEPVFLDQCFSVEICFFRTIRASFSFYLLHLWIKGQKHD